MKSKQSKVKTSSSPGPPLGLAALLLFGFHFSRPFCANTQNENKNRVYNNNNSSSNYYSSRHNDYRSEDSLLSLPFVRLLAVVIVMKLPLPCWCCCCVTVTRSKHKSKNYVSFFFNAKFDFHSSIFPTFHSILVAVSAPRLLSVSSPKNMHFSKKIIVNKNIKRGRLIINRIRCEKCVM